ncbi:MAG: hypothetical protein HW421_2985 [Ignavibacteria bacterium]|nr:hypothetical protein [Ignavibacteria bacterium]
MKLLKYIPEIIFFFIVFAVSLPAQINIEIPDTSIQRGFAHKILLDVTGNINLKGIKEIKIIFQYNALLLDISSVRGGSDCAMGNALPFISKNYPLNHFDSAYFVVSDTVINSKSQGKICSLEIEGLAGDDSIAYIKPYRLYIDGIEKQFSEKTARITLKGDVTKPYINEGLDLPYPNPFDEFTLIPVSINKTSKVNFSLYSIDGTKIDFGKETGTLNFSILDENGKEVDYFFTKELTAGYYTLKVKVDMLRASCCMYFIVMETGMGIYNRKIVINK